MPKDASCTCGECRKCLHRKYMQLRRQGNIILPELSPWEKDAKAIANSLSHYECPLGRLVADAESLIGRSKVLRMAAGAAMMDLAEEENGYLQ